MKRCLGCMEEYSNDFSVCPHCGFVEGTQPEEAIHIIPGTILNNRFIVGKAIGFGGFGVTYIGWDTVLEHKVAIKEYLPSEFSTRIPGRTVVTVFEGEKSEQFKSGLDKFVDEAKRLAKFNNTPGIVKVYDSFYENQTAYIVMEYLEGETLEEILKRQKTFPADTAIGMMLPIMESLKVVNAEGIIHRDIAPDNIILTADGEVKLIDFGAARYATTSHSRSLSVIVKQGYSPEEQYRSRGDQGPHTDVYAVGATLYKMITGTTPPDALERRAYFEGKKKDILTPITKYCKDIPVNTENAILNAINVRIEDRTPNMETLIEELTTDEPVKRLKGRIKKIDVLRWPLWMKISVPVAAMMIITLSVLFATGVIGFKSNIQKDIEIPEGMTRVPAIVNQKLAAAEEIIYEESLLYSIAGKEYSMVVPKDYVLTQDINAGNITAINTELQLTVSGGPELRAVPSCLGATKEEAQKLLEEAGFVGEFVEEYNATIPEGYVAGQDIEQGEYIAMGSIITLTLSLGRNPEEEFEEKEIEMINFVGMERSEALKKAGELGFTVLIKEEYSEKVAENIVMSQSIKAGKKIKNTEPVELVVSLGIKYVKVPDVTYMEEEKAIEILENVPLKYTVEYEESDTVKEGLVISQSIKDTEKVVADTVINLVVSTGKSSFAMPDVSGMSESKAKETLAGKGLVVNINYANSDDVATGDVISQDVAAGTEVKAGDSVALTVSSGEKLYEVPNVVGLDESTAVDKLEDATFKVQVTKAYDEEVEEGKVVSQTLPAGNQYRKDTDIIITVSKGKTPLTVTFNGNGGIALKGKKTLYLGDKYGEMPKALKEGYTFEGWYTDKNGGVEITSSSVLSQKNDVVLYAHWVANIYTVKLDSKGGNAPTSIEVVYDSTYENLPIAFKTGYGFTGWYTKDGDIVNNTDKVKITSDTTLYAHWEAGTVTVILNANGGSGVPGCINVKYNRKYEGISIEPTRKGYTFKGWYTSLSDGDKVTEATVVMNSENHTLYAIWEPVSVKVNLDANTGKCDVSNISVTYDGHYDGLVEPTKTGYTFLGWYTEKNGGEVVNSNSQVNNENEHTLYARWSANTYTITFYENSSDGKVTLESKKVTYDNAYGVLPTAIRTGYTFNGWYTDGVYGTRVLEDTIVSITDNQILYAKWLANEYTVTFNASGVSCSPTSKKVTYHSTYDSLPTPTRTGYTFQGWYTSTNGGGSKVESTTKVTNAKNHSLYADWKANTYTIVYNANGGTGTTSSTTHTYDLSSYLRSNGFKKDYHTFKGWSTSASGSVKYQNGASVKNLSSTKDATVNLYAIWEKNSWSSWTTALPSNIDSSTYEIETQYRYRDLVTSYGSWIIQGYTQYPKENSDVYQTTGSKKEVVTATQTKYKYYGYQICYSDGTPYTDPYPWYHFCKHANYANVWSGYYIKYIETNTTTNVSAISDGSGGTSHYCGDNSCPATQNTKYYNWYKVNNVFYYHKQQYDEVTASHIEYEYKTRTKSQTWGSYSNWSSTKYTASNTRQVEVRYRYRKR